MENAAIYFTRRAGQERARAAEAASAQARRAHLEIAVRLVNLATDPVSWRERLSDPDATIPAAKGKAALGRHDLSKALDGAFELPASGAFANLLKVIDESHRRAQDTV